MTFPSASSSFSINRPAAEGSMAWNPTSEHCERWAAPKASDTYMSAREESSLTMFDRA